jgi:hypothetical protein
MCMANRFRVSGETVLQVALALLSLVLSGLAWMFLLDGFALGG